jgi:hypothetical protein
MKEHCVYEGFSNCIWIVFEANLRSKIKLEIEHPIGHSPADPCHVQCSQQPLNFIQLLDLYNFHHKHLSQCHYRTHPIHSSKEPILYTCDRRTSRQRRQLRLSTRYHTLNLYCLEIHFRTRLHIALCHGRFIVEAGVAVLGKEGNKDTDSWTRMWNMTHEPQMLQD